MANFLGGSAFAMARDIGEGYQTVTERTFKGYTRGDMDQLAFEIEKALREIRGDNSPVADLAEVQTRNRKIQRLNTALMVLRNSRAKLR
jgi:hypothetical protein